MLTNLGKAVAKKVKESRNWAMVAEAISFWTKSRVKTAEEDEATQLA